MEWKIRQFGYAIVHFLNSYSNEHYLDCSTSNFRFFKVLSWPSKIQVQ